MGNNSPEQIAKLVTEDVSINNGLLLEAVGQMQMFRYIENFFKKNADKARKAGMKVGSGRSRIGIGCYLSPANLEMLDAHMWVNVLPDGTVEVNGDKVIANELFNAINTEFNKVINIAMNDKAYQEFAMSYPPIPPKWFI
jgi:hypothetical protein